MANRTFRKKQRGTNSKNRKPIIVITGEGRNKTENNYVISLKDEIKGVNVRWLKAGPVTDPEGILDTVLKYWSNNDLDESLGDKAYILLDVDKDKRKLELIKRLQKENKKVRFIISNPCFEVWYMAHFEYSTKEYKDSREVKRQLGKYIPDYNEAMDVSQIIRPNMVRADNNIRKLKVHYKELGIMWGEDCNMTMTDVPELLKALGVL